MRKSAKLLLEVVASMVLLLNGDAARARDRLSRVEVGVQTPAILHMRSFRG